MGYEEVAVKSNSIDGNVDANVIMTKKLKGKQMRSAETEGNAKGTCLLDRFAPFFWLFIFLNFIVKTIATLLASFILTRL
jgi:hypothetical protein